MTMCFHASALILTAPATTTLLGERLHTLTGIWNLEDFVGHCCYAAAATTIVYHGLSRLTNDPGAWLRRTINYILIPSMLIRLVLFLFSRGSEHYAHDFMALPEGPYLAAYWVVLCGTCIALLAYGGYLFMILWAAPKHRPTATIYIAGCAVGTVTCLARIAAALTSNETMNISDPIWLGCCAASAGFAFAFGYSWRIRVRELVTT